MLYNDCVKKIATRFGERFDESSAEIRFYYCPEFEIAICIALRGILPNRFEIVRGRIVAANGQRTEKDIIIFYVSVRPTPPSIC